MLTLEKLTYLYEHLPMRFDLRIQPGERVAVLGPSGAGKSTLLSLIAGFLPAASGRLLLNGEDHTATPPAKRPVSMLFQENNLFAHLTVAQNIGLGLDPGLRLTEQQRQQRAHIARQVGLEEHLERLPSQLSGGQRCGDSHTATHGAFGSLAFGIGTSEVEHVLATQTLKQGRAKTMKIEVTGDAAEGITAKDIVLAVIGKTGSAGGTGHVVEFCGKAIEALSMEGRMTLCNMAIEMGAKAGLVAPDDTTFAYLKGRQFAPTGENWEQAVAYWRTLKSDADAQFDTVVTLRAEEIAPQVTWGTNPGQVIAVNQAIPAPESFNDPVERASAEKALAYMDLKPGIKLTDVPIDKVFIGSCTNSRIEDLRAAAAIAKGRKVASGVQAIVVPGSGPVKAQAEAEGLDKIFIEAGFEWRLPGCSMCLAMNNDRLNPGERCASTSNRNFEGRQGRGGRTHLVSPAMAAAAAVAGHFADIRDIH